jgi:parallel beta-helix repeat protein
MQSLKLPLRSIILVLFLLAVVPETYAATTSRPVAGGVSASFADMIKSAGEGTTVLVTKETPVTGNVFIPRNITLRVTGGVLNVEAQARIVIEGPIEAGKEKIFAGSGKVEFSGPGRHVYPQWWGARGDGAADDTASVRKALASIELSGGTVELSTGTYRLTEGVSLPGQVRMTGEGATLLADFKGKSFLSMVGAARKSVRLSADVPSGSSATTLPGNESIKEGDILQFQDERNQGRYGRELRVVTSASGSTAAFAEPLLLPYKTSYAAAITPITPLRNIEISGIKVRATDSSDIRFLIFASNTHHLVIRNCTFVNHRHASSPREGITVYVTQSCDVQIADNRIDGVNDPALQFGNQISAYACSKTSITGNWMSGSPFGIGVWVGTGYTVSRNTVEGRRLSGQRGIKLGGAQYSTIRDNIVRMTDSGIKHEDSGRNVVTGNRIESCGYAAASAGINVSSQYQSAEDDYSSVMIKDNKVTNQTGVGIYLDRQSNSATVQDNIVQTTTDRGIVAIGVGSKIIRNVVVDSGATSIMFNPHDVLVDGNRVMNRNDKVRSFAIAFVEKPETAVFTGNVALENGWDDRIPHNILGFYANNRISGDNYEGTKQTSPKRTK